VTVPSLIAGVRRAVLSLDRRKRSGPADPAHTIVSIAPDGAANYLMTTAGPHGLVGGEQIVVSGNSEPTYNRLFGAVEAPDSPTTIVLETPGDVTLTGTGGTWVLA
jgi:hypothetical protein